MLAYIQGKIIARRTDHIVVQLNTGLGYKVMVTAKTLSENLLGEATALYLYHQVKEDGQALFGFPNESELSFFELLLGVSGIGPKSALNILSAASVDNLREAIALGDPALLTQVSGIGKKTAEKIVVELKSKVGDLMSIGAGSASLAGDELEALVGLGYSLSLARQALTQVDKEVIDSAERIRKALQLLAK